MATETQSTLAVNRIVYAKTLEALAHATDHARNILNADHHWCGWMLSNATVTAEWVFLQQCLGRAISESDREAFTRHFLNSQRLDGSWAIAQQQTTKGDISTTLETYLALKILGVSPESETLTRARNFIINNGGAEKMRMLSRFYLALFGLLPWKALPQMPPELIYLPPWFPINIYKFASWARCNIIPLTILRVHQPVYALPNGLHMENNYIDELWVDLSAKSGLSFTKPYLILALTSPLGLFFQLGELFLWIATKLRLWLWRRQAISACVSWILTRQETSGDWAGIYPPMHLNILALLLEGFSQTHPVIQGGLAACERFLCEHPKHGKWMQASISPVWDTFLMVRALSDTREAMTPGQHGAQENKDDVAQLLIRPVAWLMEQQINDDAVGDWRIYRPGIPAGGFAFEYFNRWYPDVDDTAVGIVALLRLPDVAAQLVNSQRILAAAAWVMGMQNKRGGWAAFDADNNAHYLHATPFSDMESLCDDSTPDVTGHVLEMFGLMYLLNRLGKVHDPEVKAFLKHSRHACIRGIEYLVDSQETFGGWYGRWGVNYIFGTNAVLVGLAYFVDPESDEYHGKESLRNVLTAGIDWLRSRQNTDGGWGECVESYTDKRLAGYGKSTPSQTAWALLGLLEFVDPRDSMIQAGVDWLLQRQVSTDNDELKSCCDTGTWYEPEYTATGFPGHFYLRYELYSHYFPMTALARHASLLRQVLEELNVAKASG